MQQKLSCDFIAIDTNVFGHLVNKSMNTGSHIDYLLLPLAEDEIKLLLDCGGKAFGQYQHLDKNTIYIIGGREHPFYAAVTCPRKKCMGPVHLAISPDAKKAWEFLEHRNGTLSLSPSIFVTGSPCQCHFWIIKGRVIWHQRQYSRIPVKNYYMD